MRSYLLRLYCEGGYIVWKLLDRGVYREDSINLRRQRVIHLSEYICDILGFAERWLVFPMLYPLLRLSCSWYCVSAHLALHH